MKDLGNKMRDLGRYYEVFEEEPRRRADCMKNPPPPNYEKSGQSPRRQMACG
jgi:hypothetical protein